MLTNGELVKYAEAMLGHQYWYGTYGQKATKALLGTKREQYPKYYDPSKYKTDWTCDGKKVFDCCGLIKGAIWCDGDPDAIPKYNASQDLNANGMYEVASEKGPINTIPEIPGICVRYNGHVGIYVGRGWVIEARGHDYGVVKTALNGRGWTEWYKNKFINYTNKKDTIQVTTIIGDKTYTGILEEV